MMVFPVAHLTYLFFEMIPILSSLPWYSLNFAQVNSLYNSSVCAVLVSEELEDPIIVEDSLAGDGSV